MTKIKKMRVKLVGALILAIAFAVIGIGYGVKAYQSGDVAPKVVIENGNFIEAPQANQANVAIDEPVLGSVTSPDIQSRYLCVNNVCTYYLVQTFIDASTTIVSIPNPYRIPTTSADGVVIYTDDGGQGYTGATATVRMARLDITGAATTTFSVSCGASANAVDTASYALVSSGSIVTSSLGIVENNLTAALGGMVNGGTVAKVALTPTYPYFTCVVTPYVAAAFTQSSNTFDGKISIEISRTK